MGDKVQLKFSFKKVPNNANYFEFTLVTALLRAQFRLPREVVNRLRVDLERALTGRDEEVSG